MCGRFAFYQEIDPLLDDLHAVDLTDGELRKRWNVPPTAPIHVVTESVDEDSGEVLRALRVARWGLLPPFAKDETFSSRTFNARRETIEDKPSFRGSLGSRRAIVPMDGYYEWVRGEGGRSRKQPYFITPADGSRLYMAALVAWWKGPGHHEGPAASEDGSFLLTTTIITREATGELARIHDRTPVMLRREEIDGWLDTAMDDRHDAAAWIRDDVHLLDDTTLELREVGPAVGKVGNDGPELIEPEARLL